MKKRRDQNSFSVRTLSAHQRIRPARIQPARPVRGNLAPVKKVPSQEKQPLRSRIPVWCVVNPAPGDASSAQFALCGAICHALNYPRRPLRAWRSRLKR